MPAIEIGAFLRQSAPRHVGGEGSGRTPVAVEACPPAARAAREDVRVMKQAVEHGGDGRGIAEELPPVLHGTIRSQQGGRPFVPAHNDLQEVFGRGVRQLAHP